MTDALDVLRVRAAFPALDHGVAHFDGPGGSQVPTPIATAVARTLTAGVANRGTVTDAERRAQLGDLLADRLPDVRWVPPESTFLAWLDCRAYGGGSAPRDRFLARGRVALEPGPNFGALAGGWVRLNFATGADILEEAVSRMSAAVEGAVNDADRPG